MALFEAKEKLPKLFVRWPGDIVDIDPEVAKPYGDSLVPAPKGAKATVINEPGKPVRYVEKDEGAIEEAENEDKEYLLTDIRGVGPATGTKLEDAGIDTIEKLEAAIDQKLADVIEILGGEEKAAAIKKAITELA